MTPAPPVPSLYSVKQLLGFWLFATIVLRILSEWSPHNLVLHGIFIELGLLTALWWAYWGFTIGLLFWLLTRNRKMQKLLIFLKGKI